MWFMAKIKFYLLGAAAFIALLGAAVLKGQSLQKTRQAKEELEDYVDTRNNIDEGQRAADRVDPVDWLQERIDKRDL